MTEILPPEQERWARRLAQSQTQRDELVRLLGLLAQLGVAAGRHLEANLAAREVTDLLLNYLQADYCGLMLADGVGGLRPAAYSGVTLPAELSARLERQMRQGNPNAAQIDDALGSYHLVCAPLRNQRELLAVLGLVLRQELDQVQLRHLGLAMQACLPMLENILVRERLNEARARLEQLDGQVRDHLQNALDLSRAQEASLAALLDLQADPLFVADGQGRLLRHNAALARLLGREGQALEGLALSQFLGGLDQDAVRAPEISHRVELRVQCGGEIAARLRAVPLDLEAGGAAWLGRLTPEAAGRELDPPPTPDQDSCHLVGEVVNQANNLLMALHSQVELILLLDLPQEPRRRLEALEALARDGGEAMGRLLEYAERLRDRGRQRDSLGQLWGADPSLDQDRGD
jgi:PAS domain-containing protein